MWSIESVPFNIAEEWDNKYFQMLVDLFKKIHIDNMEILKALIYTRNDPLPLFDCSTKKGVVSSNTSFSLVITVAQLTYLFCFGIKI